MTHESVHIPCLVCRIFCLKGLSHPTSTPRTARDEMREEDVNEYINQMITEQNADPLKLEGYCQHYTLFYYPNPNLNAITLTLNLTYLLAYVVGFNSLYGQKGFRKTIIGGIVKGKDKAAQREWAARQVYIALGAIPPRPFF